MDTLEARRVGKGRAMGDVTQKIQVSGRGRMGCRPSSPI